MGLWSAVLQAPQIDTHLNQVDDRDPRSAKSPNLLMARYEARVWVNPVIICMFIINLLAICVVPACSEKGQFGSLDTMIVTTK